MTPVALEALYHQALLLRDCNDDSAHAVAPLNPTSFGDVLEARKPGTSVLDTESDVGFQMMRVNSLGSLIRRITGHLRERSAARRRGDGMPRVQGRRRGGDDQSAERGRG